MIDGAGNKGFGPPRGFEELLEASKDTLPDDINGSVQNIIEKPNFPPSNYAVTGLDFVDGTAPDRAKKLKIIRARRVRNYIAA